MAGAARPMEKGASEKARSDRIHAVRERASTENFGQRPDESGHYKPSRIEVVNHFSVLHAPILELTMQPVGCEAIRHDIRNRDFRASLVKVSWFPGTRTGESSFQEMARRSEAQPR